MFYFFKSLLFIFPILVMGGFLTFATIAQETHHDTPPSNGTHDNAAQSGLDASHDNKHLQDSGPHDNAPHDDATGHNGKAEKSAPQTSFPLSVSSIEHPPMVEAPPLPAHRARAFKEVSAPLFSDTNESDNSVFLVKNVSVELTPSLNSDIRQAALEQAQVQAFRVLFKRMTGQEPSSLPQAPILRRLIKSYQVQDEVITGRFYKARYTVVFFPEAVRTLLHAQNISFAETYSKPILLIPLYRIDGKPLPLFSKDNTWLEHWQQTGQQQQTLVRLIIPSIDTTGLLYDDIAEKRMVNILQFLQQNDVEIALISIASLYTTPDQPYRLEITDRLISKTGQIESLPSFSVQSTIEPLNKLMQTVLEKSLNRLENSWKNHNLLKNKEIQQQVVHVAYEDLPQWLELKERLNKVSLIQNYQITELLPNKLTLVIHHYGSIDHLKQAVDAHNLHLYSNHDQWFLQPAAVHQYLQEGATSL